MKLWRYYGPLFNTILIALLLGVALALFFNVQIVWVSWVTLLTAFILTLLLWDAVRLTRRTMFRVRTYNKAYGKTFTNEVATIFKPKALRHPALDSHIGVYYEVPALDGSLEYISRLNYYKWLTKVWAIQKSPHRGSQASPLSRTRWESELGGTNKYEAYLYILKACNAIDPESTYHVKLLRMSPWNIILIADEILTVKEL